MIGSSRKLLPAPFGALTTTTALFVAALIALGGSPAIAQDEEDDPVQPGGSSLRMATPHGLSGAGPTQVGPRVGPGTRSATPIEIPGGGPRTQ